MILHQQEDNVFSCVLTDRNLTNLIKIFQILYFLIWIDL